jgi:hypothetical protein
VVNVLLWIVECLVGVGSVLEGIWLMMLVEIIDWILDEIQN